MSLRIRLFRKLLSLAAICISSNSFALTLEVLGWAPAEYITLKEHTSQWLGDDPIIGRLACPALTRLEVNSAKNVPLLLKAAPAIEKSGKSETWMLHLRQGLRWWSGGNVESESLNEFLKLNLPLIAQSKLGVSTPLKFDSQIISNVSLKINWPEGAPFGVNILSGVSLARVRNGQTECAGLYNATQVAHGYDLSIGNGYSAKYSKISVRTDPTATTKADHSIIFSMAHKSTSALTTSINTSSCSVRMDAPMVTPLVWNAKSPLASTAQLRQALTMATPRGEILRTAAGDVGSLVSAPILRSHPGYEAKNLVRNFSLETASNTFEQAGFKQPHIGMPRSGSGEKPVGLKIIRNSGKQELIEKMLSDSFASIGIDTKFFDEVPASSEPDAVLASFALSWPSQDLMAYAEETPKKHLEGAKPLFPFKPVSDKSLRELTLEYAKSLTHLSPDFSSLRKIHTKWFELEPWTILMAHQYCVETKGIKNVHRINILDPDWFRHIAVD